jgi:hypothetical protein
MRKQLFAVVTCAAAAVALVGPSPALAHRGSPKPVVVSADFAAPFNLEVTRSGVLVADGFINGIFTIDHRGNVSPLVPDVTGAAGVATARGGKLLAYTSSVGDENGFTSTELHIVGKHGFHAVADTLAHENAENPDQSIHYGLTDPTECQTQALESVGFPVSYTGALDSHPYSVASFRGKWVVADAGANALLLVDNKGNVRTLSVLPAQPAPITQEAADMFGLDPCVVGAIYAFESVPTDVEVGRDGFLYVTTLPGGPEDPSLGARGSVYRVDPRSGRSHRIATGFSGATNLALDGRGHIFVTELFAGRVSMVRHGHPVPFVDLPGAVSVEAGRDGGLWAGTVDLSGASPGTVVRIAPGGHRHHHHHH